MKFQPGLRLSVVVHSCIERQARQHAKLDFELETLHLTSSHTDLNTHFEEFSNVYNGHRRSYTIQSSLSCKRQQQQQQQQWQQRWEQQQQHFLFLLELIWASTILLIAMTTNM